MTPTITVDPDTATFTIAAEFDAAPDEVWQLWADPRRLEQWWGPPTHPATVTDHELTVGGSVAYYMTAPDGERMHGGWRIVGVDAPHRLEFEDVFTDGAGDENPDLPVSRSTVTIRPIDRGSRMTIVARYRDADAMQQVLDMGMAEGITLCLGQAEALLAA